mmetsp:Transcript_845/g.3547  ORF Transcript_845/g.3547 Transcript_845/m.3547 type:complete len:202 (+) Transcript_845:2564-3169(+)
MTSTLHALDRPGAYPTQIRRAHSQLIARDLFPDTDLIRHGRELLEPRPAAFVREHDGSRRARFFQIAHIPTHRRRPIARVLVRLHHPYLTAAPSLRARRDRRRLAAAAVVVASLRSSVLARLASSSTSSTIARHRARSVSVHSTNDAFFRVAHVLHAHRLIFSALPLDVAARASAHALKRHPIDTDVHVRARAPRVTVRPL